MTEENRYTVVAVDYLHDEMSDALLVEQAHLITAIDELTQYWKAHEDEEFRGGIRCVVYQGSVRHERAVGEDPVPWTLGMPLPGIEEDEHGDE